MTIFGPAQPQQFRNAVVASALYVSNWQLIFGDVSYFARFAPPGPLNHLWSLAIEEQFYIVWPFVLLLGVRLVREAPLPSGVRPRLAGVTLLLAIASAILMAALYHPSLDPSRVYYGTDTRASELLFGARAGDGLAEPKAEPEDRRRRPQHARRPRCRRPAGDRADDLADQPVLLVPVPAATQVGHLGTEVLLQEL